MAQRVTERVLRRQELAIELHGIAVAVLADRSLKRDDECRLMADTLMSMANDLGHGDAAYRLAEYYKRPRRTLDDRIRKKMLCHYMRRAAEAESPVGMYEYGCLLAEGIGCEIDSSTAIQWLERAAAVGVTKAKRELKRLSK